VGERSVIDLVQSKRTKADVLAEIARVREANRDVIDAFHRVFYDSRQTWPMTYFEGVPLLKNPLDLWVYQDIIWDLKPTLIIETGTAFGGSALWFARQLDKRGPGAVVSVDLSPADSLPMHSKVSFVQGSSVDPEIVAAIGQVAKTHPRVMVVLDSDHSAAHVTAELDAYASMVTPGQFLVVEDTNINGRPVQSDWKGGDGPGPAVDAWLPNHPEFERDLMAERYLVTHAPSGWLRRVL
jgi:cephalosporin hydroxylase